MNVAVLLVRFNGPLSTHAPMKCSSPRSLVSSTGHVCARATPSAGPAATADANSAPAAAASRAASTVGAATAIAALGQPGSCVTSFCANVRVRVASPICLCALMERTLRSSCARKQWQRDAQMGSANLLFSCVEYLVTWKCHSFSCLCVCAHRSPTQRCYGNCWAQVSCHRRRRLFLKPCMPHRACPARRLRPSVPTCTCRRCCSVCLLWTPTTRYHLFRHRSRCCHRRHSLITTGTPYWQVGEGHIRPSHHQTSKMLTQATLGRSSRTARKEFNSLL